MFPSIFNITLGSMFWHGIATFEPRRHDFCASSVQHDKTDKENIGYCTICKFKILIKTAFTYRIGCEGIFLNPNLNWHLHSLSLCPLLWSSSHLPPFATVPFPDLLLSWHPLQVLLPFMVPLSLCVYLPFHSPPPSFLGPHYFYWHSFLILWCILNECLSCERAVCLHVFLVDVLLCIVEKGLHLLRPALLQLWEHICLFMDSCVALMDLWCYLALLHFNISA